MSLALLIIFMLVAYGLTTLFRRWIDIPTLIAVAIGCAVNANIFNPLTNASASAQVGDLVFSIEIVLYTLFMYTLVVRILDYGYKEAKRMTFTSVAAIIISAIIELVAYLMASGFKAETFKNFSYYLFSVVGTIVGAWLMVWITIQCRKKNISPYLIIPFAIIASSLVHAVIYYGGISLMEWNFESYSLYSAIGTMIGKVICVLLSILCYFINKTIWQPLNLVEKEENNKDN